MAKKQLNLTYALKNNLLVHISDVERGKNCQCVCPACNEPLIAKKGEKVLHHFAHSTGHVCEYGYETSLHLAAKDILLQAKKMIIPSVKIHFPHTHKKYELISNAQEISIDSVELEKRIDNIIPDIVVNCNGKRFLIEIFVTHRIDDSKLSKIKNLDISTIEIDLSKKDYTITKEELQKILLEDSEEKSWKYNSIANKYLNKFYKLCEKKTMISRGYSLHIDRCPMSSRIWNGKSYANAMDDCTQCKYCYWFDSNKKFILCAGTERIDSVKDFQISLEQRIQNSQKEIKEERDRLLADGWCPQCKEGQLKPIQNALGSFLGCDRYPYCKFTASIDSETGELIPNIDPAQRRFKIPTEVASLPGDTIFSLVKKSNYKQIKIAKRSWLSNKWVVVGTIKVDATGNCYEIWGATYSESRNRLWTSGEIIKDANKPLWRILEILDEPIKIIDS